MKKILATILALVMALGLCSVSWADGDGTASGNMTGADFLAKAKDGVITLTNNVTLSTSCSISDGQTYTINLNEHTLSADNTTIMLRHGKLIVNGTGTIKENSPNFGAIIIKGSVNSADTNYSVVEVNAGVILEGWAPIFVDQNAAKAYGVSVTVNGATLNAKKDTTGAGGAGIYVNGQITDENNAPVISLTNTKICDVDNASQGMYLAGYATTTLTNCDITGMTGVEIRAGKLTVNGGSLKATAEYSVDPNGNGSTTKGAAIAIAQHTTKKNIEVTLNGGTYTGEKAISESNPQRNDPAPQVAMSVTAGTFVGDVVTADVTNFISGGTFSTPVREYVIADLKYEATTNDGKYTYHSTLDNAVAAAGDNGHIDNISVDSNRGTLLVKYNDGTGREVRIYTSMVAPEVPTMTREGYTFKGWLIDEGTTVYADLSTIEFTNDGATLTAVWSANSYYYYSPSTTTTDTTTKGSPKTFDAGVGIYAVTAVLSVTGMAWTAKKRH